MTEAPEKTPEDLWAALDQARAHSQGQPAAHWQRIDALARRTQAHQGAVRTLLEVRLRSLLSQVPAQAPTPPAPEAKAPSPSPLRALLQHLRAAEQGPARDASPSPDAAPDAPPAPEPAAELRELKAVQQHRHTWARLRASQRVAQSRTALPPQAGPMNTQRLLHQALQHMHATSAGYLQHFSTQAEALMWLEAALSPPAPAPAAARKTRKR